jgi:hypothetical protein
VNGYEVAGELVAVVAGDGGGSEGAGADADGLGVDVFPPLGDLVGLGLIVGPRGSFFGFLLRALAVWLSGGVAVKLVAPASVEECALFLGFVGCGDVVDEAGAPPLARAP